MKKYKDDIEEIINLAQLEQEFTVHSEIQTIDCSEEELGEKKPLIIPTKTESEVSSTC